MKTTGQHKLLEKTKLALEMEKQHEIESKQATIKEQADIISKLQKKLSELEHYRNESIRQESVLEKVSEEQHKALQLVEEMTISDLLRREELLRLNLQMEKFLYSTSHDLRSPITTILGLANLLRMETKDSLVLDYVSKIETSANKLDKTIRDIMTYSRTAYQRIKSQRIDFESMLWKIWQLFGNEKAFIKINITIQVTGDSAFYSDTQRIEIIFDKILENAIHFYDENKASPFVNIQVSVNDERAQIEFIDNGIGIPKAYTDHIFTMFYKASHISRGAGLGLFIVKETTARLKGKIQVESEIGFGSVFRITIPNDVKGKLINRKIHLQESAK